MNTYLYQKNSAVRRWLSAALLVMVWLVVSMTAFAENLPCQTATATGHYRHPQTGIIEDSGGESNEALGQSMVGNVVDSTALVETASDGTFYVSLRFHLMNNLTDIKLSVQSPGSSSWTSVSYEKTASGDDSGDLRFRVSDTSDIIRAECMVDAMGRYVIFFVTLDDFTDGNAGGFVQMQADTDDTETPETEATETEVSAETASASSAVVSTSAQDYLAGTTGLIIGGGSDAAAASTTIEDSADTVAQAASVTSAAAGEPQQLNISGQVWLMLFILMFCANVLGAMAFWGIQTLIRHMVAPDAETNVVSENIDDSIEDELIDFDAAFADETIDGEIEEK